MLILAGGDMHHPFQDDQVEADFLHAAKTQKPDHIVLLGDVVDFYNTSRYIKAGHNFNIQDELDITREFLEKLRAGAPSSTHIWWTEGNHDERPHKYIARNAPGMVGLHNMEVPMLLNLADLNIHWRTGHDILTLDGIMYAHGTHALKWPGDSVRRQILEEFHRPAIVGHCHRMAMNYYRHGDQHFVGVEAGCMCSNEASKDYLKGKVPRWTRGFVFMSNGIPAPVPYNH